MKVKELIELLEQENPKAEVYTHSGMFCMDIFKLESIDRGYSANNDGLLTHSEWAYVNEMYSTNGLTIPIVILEEE